ncbi:unnamed protein product [Caenorhabditis nigoni]
MGNVRIQMQGVKSEDVRKIKEAFQIYSNLKSFEIFFKRPIEISRLLESLNFEFSEKIKFQGANGDFISLEIFKDSVFFQRF